MHKPPALGFFTLGFSCLLTCLLCCLSLAATADDATYVIQLIENGTVGDRYKMEMEMEQKRERTVRKGEEVLESQEESNQIQFNATIEVLEVNELGVETNHCYHVHKAILKYQDQTLEILAPDTEVIAEADNEEPQFYCPNGEELSELAKSWVPYMIPTSTGEMTFRKLFGSKTPRRVGDTWEAADLNMLVTIAKKRGQEVAVEDVSGEATLVGIKTIDDTKCFELHIKIKFKNLAPDLPPQGLPPQKELVSSTTTVLSELICPVDTYNGPLSQSHTTILTQVHQGKKGTPREGKTFKTTSTVSYHAKYKYLAP